MGTASFLFYSMLASTSEADRKTIAALLETALAELTDSPDRGAVDLPLLRGRGLPAARLPRGTGCVAH